MPPKKEKPKPSKTEDKTAAVTEVERTFLELQIAELNIKVARLRTAVDEYEVRNEELQKAYDKLDEDRADIIAFLKKTLNLKNEENTELKEKVKGLEETREIETAQFKETVAELEKNFMVMKDQLTSENKLLAGKLNTLEEFRAIRDDLMRKFEKQEQAFKDQEMKYKRIIYEAEKKFVIGKDKLKKEMEGQLLQLAQDFQDATELRIAASTHRVIRENIAINNELDSILATQAKLADQNEKYKESEKAAKIAMELAEEERDKAINKNVVQLKVIDQLTTAFQSIRQEKGLYEKRNYDFEILQSKIQKLVKENENLTLQVRILEQNLHARMCEQNQATVEASKVIKECAKLKKILREAGIAVQAALKLDEWASKDPTKEVMDRQALLSRLLDIITQYRELQRAESIDTLASLGRVYEEGDLGFIPKSTKRKSMSPVVSTTSKESVKVDKRDISEISVSTSSLGSIKTIPSIKLVPPSTEPLLAAKESIASFVTSTQSTVSLSESEIEVVPESEMSIQQMLEASKLEIQKSILKDLQYSQMALESQARMASAVKGSKSVIIEEPGEGVEAENKESEVEAEQTKELAQQKLEDDLTEKPEEEDAEDKGREADDADKDLEAEKPTEG